MSTQLNLNLWKKMDRILFWSVQDTKPAGGKMLQTSGAVWTNCNLGCAFFSALRPTYLVPGLTGPNTFVHHSHKHVIIHLDAFQSRLPSSLLLSLLPSFSISFSSPTRPFPAAHAWLFRVASSIGARFILGYWSWPSVALHSRFARLLPLSR
jgi:hypothetical protein